MAKKKTGNDGIVYSTNPDFNFSENEEEKVNYPPINLQKIRIILDKKQRAGKVVTLIYGFENTYDEIEKTGKEIKKYCGAGGSVKDGEIIIQGDFRNKALQWLLKNGYNSTKII